MMADTNQVEAPPSVLHLLNQSNRRLERLLQNLRNERNAESELRDSTTTPTAVSMQWRTA